jgi:ubiquinone biosynthesis protein UbiJ
MTTRQFVTKSGDTWEWEETEETRKAVEELHKTIGKLESEAPDYGVGK